jgi:hypothetical protein
MRKVILAVGAWAAVITTLHVILNVDYNVLLNDRLPVAKRKLYVAYIPVT